MTFNIRSFFNLVFIFHFVSSTEKCNITALQACQKDVMILDVLARFPPENDTQEFEKACDTAEKCVSRYNCSESLELADKIFNLCENPKFMFADVPKCFSAFYAADYLGEYNCTQNYQFSTFNLTEKRSAFTSGKSCFLEVVENECKNDSFKYIKDHFNETLDYLTVEPKNQTNGSCKGYFHVLSLFQCEPVSMELVVKLKEFNMEDASERHKELTALCKTAKSCTEKVCDKSILTVFDNMCGYIQILDSKLMKCASEVFEDEEIVENYKCVGDLFEDSDRCSKPDKLKKCYKSIVEENCRVTLATEKEIDEFSEKMALGQFRCHDDDDE